MANKLTIDTTKYVTAVELAKELTDQGKPVTPQMINNWRRRGKIDCKYFDTIKKWLYVRGSIGVKGY